MILRQDLAQLKRETFFHLNLPKAVRLSVLAHIAFQNHPATYKL